MCQEERGTSDARSRLAGWMRFARLITHICSALAVVLQSAEPAGAQSQFAPGEEFIEEVVLKDLPISTAIAFASKERAYLALKIGVVRVVKAGVLQTAPFLDISAIVNKVTDRGLLGLAVDPEFPQKPYIYLSYVYDPPGSTPDSADPRVIQIARVTADASKDYDVAVPGSLTVLVGKQSILENIAPATSDGDPNIPERASCMSGLTMDGGPIEDCIPNDYPSHSAGTLLFGPGRVLYASLGDGADYTKPNRVGLRTQNIDAMSGRVLRIDADTGAGLPDNPWYSASKPFANRSRTWMYGFRNPFRIARNPGSDRVYVGDVGTSYYEEINEGKGGNFGWPCYEGGFVERSQQEGPATGSIQQVGYKAAPRTIDFCNAMYSQGQGVVRKSLFTYRHPYDATGKDLGASVTGLAFYTGTSYPERHRGALFFADYAQRFIRYLTFDGTGGAVAHNFAAEVGSNLGAVELLIGPDENLYAVYIDLKTRTSQVRRFRPKSPGNSPPRVIATVSPTAGDAPLVVAVNASTSVDPDGQALAFEWDFGDGQKGAVADGTHRYEKPGVYTAVVTVREVTAPFLSSSESFVVRVGVASPIAVIDAPQSGMLYEVGKTISFSGHAEGVPEGSASFLWSVLQVHNEHTHLVTEVEGQSGSFVPTEHTDNTSHELCLLVSTGQGVSDTQCVRLMGRTSVYSFESQPQGASMVYLDEEKEVSAPYLAHPIVGSRQTLTASRMFAGRTFVGWSDGERSSSRNFLTGAEPMSFKALYRNLPPKSVLAAGASTQAGPGKAREILLDGSGSSDPEGEQLRYQWRFSDGGRYRSASVKKRFTRDGRYNVRLTVSDPLGGVARSRNTIVVSSGKPLRLTRWSGKKP